MNICENCKNPFEISRSKKIDYCFACQDRIICESMRAKMDVVISDTSSTNDEKIKSIRGMIVKTSNDLDRWLNTYPAQYQEKVRTELMIEMTGKVPLPWSRD